MTGDFRVFPDKTALARAAAAHFVELAESSIIQNGRFSVALSGGTTPGMTYRLLATPEFSNQIDWMHVHLFWSDERCVPPEHEESNYGMANKVLIGRTRIPMENIHRIRGEEVPTIAAGRYEQDLKNYFKGGPPRFDLVLLGLGEDGHTASVFPGATSINESKHSVLAAQHPQTGQWRVTLTLTAINAAANVTFLVAGESKRTMVQVVRSRSKMPEEVPAIGVVPRDGMVLWLCDQTASPL